MSDPGKKIPDEIAKQLASAPGSAVALTCPSGAMSTSRVT
jgi:hypothetical protein